MRDESYQTRIKRLYSEKKITWADYIKLRDIPRDTEEGKADCEYIISQLVGKRTAIEVKADVIDITPEMTYLGFIEITKKMNKVEREAYYDGLSRAQREQILTDAYGFAIESDRDYLLLQARMVIAAEMIEEEEEDEETRNKYKLGYDRLCREWEGLKNEKP